MKKKDILKLKSMALSIMLASSAIMLSGCDSKEESSNKSKTHHHAIVNIGNQVYIFRECVDGVNVQELANSELMIIETKEGKMYFHDGVYYKTSNEFMIEQEKVALKDGAIVYGNSTDDYSLCLK